MNVSGIHCCSDHSSLQIIFFCILQKIEQNFNSMNVSKSWSQFSFLSKQSLGINGMAEFFLASELKAAILFVLVVLINKLMLEWNWAAEVHSLAYIFATILEQEQTAFHHLRFTKANQTL